MAAYIDDMLEGIYLLMQSNLDSPVNIGCPQYVFVKELVDTVAEVSRKKINVRWVEGSVGVHSRNFCNKKIYSLGWCPKYYLKEGIELTFPLIDEQVRKVREKGRKRD